MKPRHLFAALAGAQLAAALFHFGWLPELARGAAAAGVPGPYRRLLLLVTAAVGLLLGGMGVLSARLAGGERWREPGARPFALVGALVWGGRVALEVRLPVEVPLLGWRGLSPAVLAGSVAISAAFLLAWARAGEHAAPPPPRAGR